jgi:type IV pilus assembly protein PilO
MKEIVNKLIANLHWVLLPYALLGIYTAYEEQATRSQDFADRMKGIQDEVIISQKKVKEIQDYTKKTDEYKVRVEEVAKNIEAVQKQLPSETNDPNILTYLQSETSTINIKDANFTPGKEEKSTYYVSKDYNLKGKGTFLQFLIFFERIGNADRIYNIKELKLTTPTEFQKGRFQIISGEGVIQAYRLNPEFKVDRGF